MKPSLLPDRPIAALLLTALAAAPSSGQEGYKGPAWTPRDSIEASAFIRAFRENPRSIDSLAAGPGNMSQERELGFGHVLKEVWVNPAGKLGFSLKILRRASDPSGPVAFEVKPVMNYAGLAARCHAVLKHTFAPTAPGEAGAGTGTYRPYHWNFEAAAAALPPDSVGLKEDSPLPTEVRKALAYYMTPYSGTTYGIRGGRNGQILENRDRFMNLADTLMAEKTRALYLLRSLNPATRLTAAEFIIRHKQSFPAYEALHAKVLKRVFANPAKAETMRGGAVLREDARKLAFEYAQVEVKRVGRGVFRQ